MMYMAAFVFILFSLETVVTRPNLRVVFAATPCAAGGRALQGPALRHGPRLTQREQFQTTGRDPRAPPPGVKSSGQVRFLREMVGSRAMRQVF